MRHMDLHSEHKEAILVASTFANYHHSLSILSYLLVSLSGTTSTPHTVAATKMILTLVGRSVGRKMVL